MGRGSRLCGEGNESQTAGGGHVQCFVGEVEVTNDGMVDAFVARVVYADIMGRPQFPKVVAAGRQFADEVGQGAIIGSTTGLTAQQRDQLLGRVAPIAIEVDRTRVQEEEAREIT